MVGVSKSLVTTGAAAVPSSVTNQTIYITGIYNGHADTATISYESEDGNGDPAGGAGATLIKLKTGDSFTPAVPVPVKAERKIHSNKSDVTITYVAEGGAAIAGPNGYPWGTKSNPNFEVTGTDNFGGPYAYSY